MRDYADKKYRNTNSNTNQKNAPSKKAKQTWFNLVPSWAWLIFGIFVGFGLSNVPFLSNFQNNKQTSEQSPNFDEKLAREIQDLKATNEAANKALKEDLDNIKKASLEAGDAAKNAAKQAQIAAGQIEKSTKQTSEKVASVEQKLGTVEKLVSDNVADNNSDADLTDNLASNSSDKNNKVEKADQNPNLASSAIADSKKSESQKQKPSQQQADTKNNEAKVDSANKAKEQAQAKETKGAKNDEAKKDSSLDFDFYELLPQSEVKVAQTPNNKSEASTEESLIVLQVGSFRHEADAKRHKANLDKLNLGESKVVKAQMKNEDWFRVYLGPYNTRRKASEMQNRLAQAGFEALQIKLK